ncbi:hypothetical protein, partial [Methylophaga sp.]|uniref:hypothetical protein n=1 Tax=Methylophaga sp. TaxID=2024840 RepID=UPI0027190911
DNFVATVKMQIPDFDQWCHYFLPISNIKTANFLESLMLSQIAVWKNHSLSAKVLSPFQVSGTCSVNADSKFLKILW